jgi:tripartite-type tricarboxylate transporter receptor subunit TctC
MLASAGHFTKPGKRFDNPRPSRNSGEDEENPMKARARLLLPFLLLAGLSPAAAQAPAWPARPIRFIVPFGPGGPADLFARAIAQQLAEPLGQPVVVENRPGAGAVIGTEQAAKSAPDGYTFLVISSTHTVNETLLATRPYGLLRDFAGVAAFNATELVLVAHPSLPAAGVQDLLRLARQQPGRIHYASSGTGTPAHLAGELFKSLAGVDLTHVPYKASGGARADLLSGQVQLMFDAIPTMLEHIRAGKVKALGTTGAQRSTILPDLPTIAEAGVAGFESAPFLGLLAPKGTPAAIVQRMNEAVARLVRQDNVRQSWAAQGATALTMTPTAFEAFVQQDIDRWGRVIRAANIKPDN